MKRPIKNQMKLAIQVVIDNCVIKKKHARKVIMGKTGYNGTWKPSVGICLFCLKAITPIETAEKAINVPIFTNSASCESGVTPAKIATIIANVHVLFAGV